MQIKNEKKEAMKPTDHEYDSLIQYEKYEWFWCNFDQLNNSWSSDLLKCSIWFSDYRFIDPIDPFKKICSWKITD